MLFRSDPFATTPRPAAPVRVQATQVLWKPGSGELRASGPLQASRRPPTAKAGDALQQLTADALEGNTLTQAFTLKGLVRFEAAASGDRFSGREVALQTRESQGGTQQPFEAAHGDLQVNGKGLQVDGSQHWVKVESACQVRRPGELLIAQRCAWNWTSGDVEASGDVQLQRSANSQITTGQVLSGRLGDAGHLRISAPGGRVVSRFQLPPRRASAPPPPRPAPPPIVP